MNANDPYGQPTYPSFQPRSSMPPSGVSAWTGLPPSGAPTPSGAGRSPGRWRSLPVGVRFVAVAAVVASVVLALVAIISSVTRHPTRTVATSAPSVAAATESGPQDWLAAVCRPGTFVNGRGKLANATGGGVCRSTDNSAALLFDQYESDSEFLLHNDVAMFQAAAVARITGQDGSLYVFVTLDATQQKGMAALEPLDRFGFQRSYSARGR